MPSFSVEDEIRTELYLRARQRRENFIKDFEEEYKDPTPEFVAKEGESPRDQFDRWAQGRYHDDPRFQEPEPDPYGVDWRESFLEAFGF